jgi:hypothetical protein
MLKQLDMCGCTVRVEAVGLILEKSSSAGLLYQGFYLFACFGQVLSGVHVNCFEMERTELLQCS